MIINRITLFGLLALFFCLGGAGCVPVGEQVSGNNPEVTRWLNPLVFDQNVDIDESLHDTTFEILFAGSDGGEFTVTNCFDVFALGDTAIAQHEFTRWEWLKSSCAAASWYYRSPELAVSYWDNSFNLDLLKRFPATAIPYLGGQGLDGRNGNLAEQEPELKLIEFDENSVKVALGDRVINYVVLARGDFNRDGYQDLFIRLEWYIASAFSEGFDWVVLTKLSPSAQPVMLWRK